MPVLPRAGLDVDVAHLLFERQGAARVASHVRFRAKQCVLCTRVHHNPHNVLNFSTYRVPRTDLEAREQGVGVFAKKNRAILHLTKTSCKKSVVQNPPKTAKNAVTASSALSTQKK